MSEASASKKKAKRDIKQLKNEINPKPAAKEESVGAEHMGKQPYDKRGIPQ